MDLLVRKVFTVEICRSNLTHALCGKDWLSVLGRSPADSLADAILETLLVIWTSNDND